MAKSYSVHNQQDISRYVLISGAEAIFYPTDISATQKCVLERVIGLEYSGSGTDALVVTGGGSSPSAFSIKVAAALSMAEQIDLDMQFDAGFQLTCTNGGVWLVKYRILDN